MTASPKSSPMERRTAHLIHKVEQVVYIAVAVLLVLALALALLGAAALLWNGAAEFAATEPVYRIIDRLLFVLMMVEILHTVHASIRTDRKSTRLNSSHSGEARMPSSA